MHPPLQIKTIFNTNARHTAGRFASGYFPGEILPELTKVNKVSVISLEPISCKGLILLLVKPGSCNLHEELTNFHSPEHMQYSFVPSLAPSGPPVRIRRAGVGVNIDTTDMFSDFNILQVISRGHSITKQRYGISKDNDRQ